MKGTLSKEKAARFYGVRFRSLAVFNKAAVTSLKKDKAVRAHKVLEGSLKSMLFRRVLRRHLVRISVGEGVLRRVLRKGGVIEGAQKAETSPFAEYNPLGVSRWSLFWKLYGGH